MAEKEKRKNPTGVTPKGTFKFPKFQEPDTAFNQNAYKCTLVLPHEEAKALLQQIDKEVEQSVEDRKEEVKPADKKKVEPEYPYEDECDEEGNETGNVEIKFKQNAVIETKKGKTIDMKPALFDAKRNPIPKNTNVGGGSVGKISYEIAGYGREGGKKAGVTLRLKAAQVIQLVQYGARDADDYGFDEEEGDEVATNENGFKDEDESDNDDDSSSNSQGGKDEEEEF